MSKSSVYALFDQRSSTFQAPTLAPSDGDMTRGVILGLRSGKALFAQFPKEFQLYYIGSYDHESGLMVASVPARFVVAVGSLVETSDAEAVRE